MAKLPRVVASGFPHHVTQRGNRLQKTFFEEDDYALYGLLCGTGRNHSVSENPCLGLPSSFWRVACSNRLCRKRGFGRRTGLVGWPSDFRITTRITFKIPQSSQRDNFDVRV